MSQRKRLIIMENQKPPKTTASLLDCKRYFEEPSSSKFAAEWKKLSNADKVEIKDLVWAEMQNG